MSHQPRISQRVLVTGGAGFIGSNVVRMLLSRGDTVTVLDDFSEGKRESLRDLACEIVDGSVLDANVVEKSVQGHDAVVHLAAQTGVAGSLADPRMDLETNVVGTLNVLEACRGQLETDGSSPRLVFASSNAPLGRQTPPAMETVAPLPISPYGASKLAGEGYCLAYHGSWGVPTVILRFGNVYGPRSARKVSVVASFIRTLLAGDPLMIDGDGGQTRDFVFVGDLGEAILASIDSDVAGEVFQIATGEETSIVTLARLLMQIAGVDTELEFASPRAGDMYRNYSQISKASEMLGWHPQTSLVEGLQLTWDSFSQNSSD